jgi:hypothetical protein
LRKKFGLFTHSIYNGFLFVSLAEVAAGIAALILKGNLKEVIQDRMRDGMENYGKHSVIIQFFICHFFAL